MIGFRLTVHKTSFNLCISSPAIISIFPALVSPKKILIKDQSENSVPLLPLEITFQLACFKFRRKMKLLECISNDCENAVAEKKKIYETKTFEIEHFITYENLGGD